MCIGIEYTVYIQVYIIKAIGRYIAGNNRTSATHAETNSIQKYITYMVCYLDV